MAASYIIDSDRALISSTATGTLTDEDLRGHQRAVLADPDFRPSMNQIWDLSGVDQLEISNDAVRDLARSRSYDAGTRRAVVADADVVYGVARMFQILHDDAPEDFQIFRSLEEAKRWLGIS